jgi:hypothetical protein
VASSVEYRQYMDECLRAAAKATSEEERKALLRLAQTWHRAATSLETSVQVVEELAEALGRESEPKEP